jgi:type I restriction enzyme M protein
LSKKGQVGFVMANSAADSRASELEIHKKIIQDRAVDVMVAAGPNIFYTVTLPCMLWFPDRWKNGTDRQDKVLFLDARHIYSQND